MDLKYVVVQAGGKGSRMERLTRNKPKALVPVNNLPMIFHLFKKFQDKKFIVIGDYKFDVLKKYLYTFAPPVNFELIQANSSGTCAGISEALTHIPSGEPFLLIWCDLILGDEHNLPDTDKNVVGISSLAVGLIATENFSRSRAISTGSRAILFSKTKILSRTFRKAASSFVGSRRKILPLKNSRSKIPKSTGFTASGASCRKCAVARSIK